VHAWPGFRPNTSSWSFAALAGTAPVFAKLTGCTRPTPAVPRELLDRTLSLVRVVIVAVLLFTIIDPHFFASRFPRLCFIPVLFGGAVVLLGEVAAWSMRWRTPLLLGVVIASLVMIYLTPSFHDTRWIEATIEPSKASGDKRQISFDAWPVL
jgi:hypothetical protein